MSKKLELLLEEKIYQLQNDLKQKKIEAKTMAEFAAVFYEKYSTNYNEKLLVQICKRTMNFYNEGIKNLPDEDKEYFIEKTLKDISKFKEKLKSLVKGNLSNLEVNSSVLNLETLKDKYKSVTSDISNLTEKKPFFLLRKKWKKQIEKSYMELEKINLNLEEIKEQEENNEKNIIRKKNFKDLMEDLKEFVYEVDSEIGVKLATITYEDVMKEEKLRDYIYEVIIANLYNYFITKPKN